MTREEAIRIIRKMLACTDLSVRANLNADMVDACHLAIKALEQEPTTKNDLEVDCVSRKEVDRLACRYLKEPTDDHVAFYEHFLDLPSVTPQNQVYPLCKDCHTKMDEVRRAYDNAMKQESIIDKLRAEIEALKNAPPCFDDMFEYKCAVDDVLAIIDKYKTESEE